MLRPFGKIRIKNVQLVPVTNPGYQLYLSQYKTEKKADVVYNKPAKKKAQIMGYLLELAVRDWVSASQFYIEENIIHYQVGSAKKQEDRWKELDYVLRHGTNLTIGEVKVSTSEKGLVKKACEQLSYSRELLSQISGTVKMQIIRIDLNFQNTIEPLDEFHPEFHKSRFRIHELEGQKFQILHLSAQDVFNYGVKRKVIKSPEIFEPVIYETELRHQRRQIKELIKAKKKELYEISNVDELDIQQNEISLLEKDLFHLDIKITLSQEGWTQITCKNQDEFKTLTELLGEEIADVNSVDAYCDRTNGFRTGNPNAKYISIYNGSETEEVELKLLDAEQVYLRLSDEQQDELQSIYFVPHEYSQVDKVSYPLLSKVRHRKFHYSNTLLNNKDSNNKSLLQFEHVIRESQPTTILLKPRDVLIYDNQRMLRQTERKESGFLTKLLVLE